ncbi:protein tilB [Plutella xylostella]|uniref:protein tilB n=1 Tax=Plutella xylostella TaxID=51655 RepID=UPI002032703F|nr:protein tilB [Plutella xylostella]
MVFITVELVRKSAEHHDRELAPLEEIALHQKNIEKIEYLQDWCPKLKILLLQSNLIAKIENLNKLKYLNYLNLAMNNIEVIENLDRCESLQKLDLTLNFIGNIVSVESLVNIYNLETLYLTGNPCVDYDNYRHFVVGTLPQLTSLDGHDIERSERIQALQNLPHIRSDILFEQENYRHLRRKQKTRLDQNINEKWEKVYKDMDPDERNKKFWSEKCEHAPEVRYEMERMRQMKLQAESEDKNDEKPRELKLFAPDGRPYNLNQAKIDFTFSDWDPDQYTLDLAVYKYMDTSLVDVDVQSNYVRATIKEKIFQLHLPEEVDTVNSKAQRSQTTGHLVITMPKAKAIARKLEMEKEMYSEMRFDKKENKKCEEYTRNGQRQSKREFLEIGPEPAEVLDFTSMTKPRDTFKQINLRTKLTVKKPSPDFVDDPEVPDLI